MHSITSKIRKFIHNRPFILSGYFGVKAIFVKLNGSIKTGEQELFKKIFIETISYCNNDCAFCPASCKSGVKNPQNFMSEDLYLKILKELKDISFKGSLAFHCNNEPLLDRRLASWVKKARDLLKDNYFYLYTNGVFIDVGLVNELFEAGLNRIIVNNYNDEYILNPSIRKLVEDSFMLKGEVIVNYRVKSDYLGNRAGESPNAGSFLKKPLNIICPRPLRELVVGYDGTVPLCCADGVWKVKMGNLRETSIKDIWFSDFFKMVRKSLSMGDRKSTEICKACDALKFFSPKGIR